MSTGIVLDWDDNTIDSDLAGYNVYRSDSANGVFVKLNTDGPVATSDYTDPDAPVSAPADERNPMAHRRRPRMLDTLTRRPVAADSAAASTSS